MLHFTLDFRHAGDGRTHSSGDRQGGGCGVSVLDHCNMTVVATIISRLSCSLKYHRVAQSERFPTICDSLRCVRVLPFAQQ